MSNEISIHDNSVLSYTVDYQERRIIFRTVYTDQEPQEHTNIIFTEVIAHHFDHDSAGTILFDVEEATLEQVYSAYQQVFERDKGYGWPNINYNTQTELVAALKARNIKGFLISSSYGMDGLVLAREMRMEPVPRGGTS